LEWTSDPLTNGTYTVAVTILDEVGNESSATSEDVEVTTYARPASSLAVSSYDQSGDLLSLTWTESEDL